MVRKVCPVCKAEFSDRPSLRAHVQAQHPQEFNTLYPMSTRQRRNILAPGRGGVRSRARNPPPIRGDAPARPQPPKQAAATAPQVSSGVASRRRRPRRQGGGSETRTMSGSDLIKTVNVSVSKADKAGVMLTSYLIRPFDFNARLQLETAMWTNWKPIRLVFRATSSASANVCGTWILAFSRDLHQKSLSGTQLMSALHGLRAKASGHIYQDLTINVPVTTTRQWYTVNGQEEEETTHGRVYVMTSTPLSGITGNIGVNLTFDWTIAFMGPALIAPNPLPAGDAVVFDAGWAPLFTTSTNSWMAGKKLVFKAHEGGDIAVCSQAKLGVVYKNHDETKVYCSDGYRQVQAHWFVRPHDTPVPTLVPVESEDKARQYIASGDNSLLWDYHAAGSWCTPDILVFIPKAFQAQAKPEDEVERLRGQVEYLTQRLQALAGPTAVPVDSEPGPSQDSGFPQG